MAKMGKRAQEVKYRLNEERKQKAREEYIKSLSPEERSEFFRKEEENKKKTWNLILGLKTLTTAATSAAFNDDWRK